jgi:biotin carboxylase
MQLLIAAGQPLSLVLEIKNFPSLPQTPLPLHSLQLRLTAEDVSNNWSLSVGKITSFRLPTGSGTRVDTHMLAPATTLLLQ